MAQILAIAYNTGPTIQGTLQYGVLAVSNSNREYTNNYGGVQWWATPDLSQKYVICYPDPKGTHPTPIPNVTAYLGFWGSGEKTEQSFLYLANNIPPRLGKPDFTTAIEANDWLFDNGYWTSYPESTTDRLLPKGLELCYIYRPCDEGEDFILIEEQNADDFPIAKWFDGNCYYNTNVTTYSNEYTFLAGQTYFNCENCSSDCTLDDTLSTVDCTLIANVKEVSRPIDPTPTPTPTPTEPCFNPSVDEVDCKLDHLISHSAYNVRLKACCKEYIGQSYYYLNINLQFIGLVPSVGNVLLYNGICYEITTLSSLTNTIGVTIDPTPITYLITGSSPCKTCTTYYQPCIEITSTPTPTPTPTPNYNDRVDVRLRSCCDGQLIMLSVDTSVILIPNESVISFNGECYTVETVSNYSGGLLAVIDENNHYTGDNPCKDCEVINPCGPTATRPVTPTPTPTPTDPTLDSLFSARICCGESHGLDFVNVILPEGITLNPGDGFIYNGNCYEIIDTVVDAPIITEIESNDLKTNICDEPICGCITPTPTPTNNPTPTPTPTRVIPPIDCTPLDFVFVVDNTFSMNESISQVQNSIVEIAEFVNQESLGQCRFALVTFDERSNNIYSLALDYHNIPLDQISIEPIDYSWANPNADYIGDDRYVICWTKLSDNNIDDFISKVNHLNNCGNTDPYAPGSDFDAWQGCIPIGWGNTDAEPSDVVLDMVANSFAGEFVEDGARVVVLITDSAPGGYDDYHSEEDYNNVINMSTVYNNLGITPIVMMNTYLTSPGVYPGPDGILDESINPYVTFVQQCNGMIIDSHEPQQLINSLDILCDDIPTPTPTGSLPITPTPTPTPTREIPTIDCSPLDIVFVVDNTSSMTETISQVQNSILEITNFVNEQSEGNCRFGLVTVDQNSNTNWYSSPINYHNIPSDQIHISNALQPPWEGFDNIIVCFSKMSDNNVSEFTNMVNHLAYCGNVNPSSNQACIPIGDGAGNAEPTDYALELVANSFAGEFNENSGKIVVVLTDNLPSGQYDSTITSEDAYNNVINNMIPLFNGLDIKPIIMMENNSDYIVMNDLTTNELILDPTINPFINFSQQCGGLFINSLNPQEVINSLNILCE